jgi:hypothetical protein
MFLENVGVYLQVHTALQPRRATLTNSVSYLSLFLVYLRILCHPRGHRESNGRVTN